MLFTYGGYGVALLAGIFVYNNIPDHFLGTVGGVVVGILVGMILVSIGVAITPPPPSEYDSNNDTTEPFRLD